MSGQQWGSVIGGVIGSFIPVVGTALGSAIGGIIGGWVDPTKIYGPRLSDAQTQTAMDGVPMAYGYGTFPCKGNLIWQDIVKEHKHKDDGKGSGQEQITYTYTRSYAIGVCKGPISGYKIIKRNGKIVFDARTDAELTALGYTAEQIAESRAAQAKFKKVCTLYYGTADQLPDPTMVAVKGVGNVPAYARRAYIVLTDDETMQGEVAQYEFVVANCGDRTEDDSGLSRILISGSGDTRFITSKATEIPSLEPLPASAVPSTGALMACSVNKNGVWILVGENEIHYTMDLLGEWETVPTSFPTNAGRFASYGPGGWLIQYRGPSHAGAIASASSIPSDVAALTVTLEGGIPRGSFSWTKYTNGRYYGNIGFNSTHLINSNESLSGEWVSSGVVEVLGGAGVSAFVFDIDQLGGGLYLVSGERLDGGAELYQCLRRSSDGGETYPELLLDGRDGNSDILQLCSGGNVLIAVNRDVTKVFTSVDNFSEGHVTGVARSKADLAINEKEGRFVAFAAGRFYIMGDAGVVSTEDGITFSPVASYPPTFSLPISIAAFDPEDLQEVPDAPGYYISPVTGKIIGPDGTQISVCKPTLGEIVSRQCAKRISTDVIDVSELTEQVVGFRIAAPSSPQKNIQALQPGYFFDGSEFDGVLHFPKRGGADSFALTVDDLCERDGDLIQWETKQEPELLRKVTVGYLDPDTTYTATTQQWERRSGTVKAEGEGVLEFPVVETKDWAAQSAHKSVKVGWAEADKCTFHVSIARADLVTAAVGTITDEAGTVHRVRIERIEDEGLRRMIEARRTRADVYESTVEGASKPLPLFPGSNIRGPTDGLLLNLPVMVDSNDAPGIAWAASGYLSGWVGGTLQFQRAGQWVDAGTVTLPATMGTLLSELPAHAGDVDTTNTLHLRMNDSLESVTFTNLLQERNPLAILYPDGTAEIVQFQTATEVAAGEYELTTLLRGRLNTVAADHATGARAVFLDSSVQYAALQPTDVGTTLTYRFVSSGTDPDAATVQTLDLTTMESQREWPVFDLAVDKAGDDYTVTWRKRDRLGTDVFPIRSTNWRGYEVSWSYGGNTHTETVLTETATFNLPGASDVTFSVAQLNLYTGPGPAETVTIP